MRQTQPATIYGQIELIKIWFDSNISNELITPLKFTIEINHHPKYSNNNLMFAWLACKLPDTRISHGLSCEHAVERHFIKENFKWKKKNMNLCRVSNINNFFSLSFGSRNTKRLIGSWRIYIIENEYDGPERFVWIFLWCRFFYSPFIYLIFCFIQMY